MSFAGQVIHVFRKDVRRYWPALVGVGVLVGVHRTSGVPALGRWVPVFEGPFPIFGTIFVLFTVIVMQDHRVSGSEGFWTTRPLSGPALLVGKALFVGLFFCLLPVIIQVQWLVQLAEGGRTVQLFADSLVYQAGLLAIVAAGASLAPRMTGFLALAGMVWIGTAVVGTVVQPSGSPFIDRGVHETRAYLERWGWLVIGVSVLLHQYSTRHTLRSGLIGIASMVGLTVGLAGSPVDLTLQAWEPEKRSPYPYAESIGLRLIHLSQEEQYTGSRFEEPTATLHASVALETDDPRSILHTRVRSRLEGPGVEYSYEHRRGGPTRGMGAWHPTVPVDGIRPAGLTADQVEHLTPLRVRVAETTPERMRELQSTTRIRLRLGLDVYRPRVVDGMPLEVGRVARAGDRVFRLDEVRKYPRGMSVSGTTWSARGALDDPYGAPVGVVIYLHSPRYGEYLPVDNGGGRTTSSPSEGLAPEHYIVGGSTLVETSGTHHFSERQIRSSRWESVPPDWFDDAELILVAPEYLGSFRRSLSAAVDSLPGTGRTIMLGSADR